MYPLIWWEVLGEGKNGQEGGACNKPTVPLGWEICNKLVMHAKRELYKILGSVQVVA